MAKHPRRFHSQQIFLLGLSLFTFGFLLDEPAWTRRWWLGAVCAALALFSMGSGLLAAAIVLGAALVDGLRYRVWRERGPTLVTTALLVVAGWLLHVNFTPHEPLKAHTASDFVVTFWRACQWPTREFVLFGAVSWVPWIWLTVRIWRAGRTRESTRARRGGHRGLGATAIPCGSLCPRSRRRMARGPLLRYLGRSGLR